MSFYGLRFACRRNLDYQDVLDSLKSKGISIRVASPKLVMEEVKIYLISLFPNFTVFVCLY